MDSVTVKKVCEKHKDLVDLYFENDGKVLYGLIDKVLFKLKFDVEKSDFYSLGSEIFLDALCRYDETQDFNGFLYSCLMNKFKTEMTRRGRNKRCCKTVVEETDGEKVIYVEKIIKDDSLDRVISSPHNHAGSNTEITLADILASDKTVESELFEEENKEEWRPEVKEYLDKLSPLQRQIAFLLSDENTPEEICEELHITMKHFENSVKRILADERIRPLRKLVERN